MILKNIKYKEILINKAFIRAKPLTNIEAFSGSSPTPFIGHYGYPNINVGIMAPNETENAWKYDAPRYWAESNKQISDIVDYRTQLVNSRFKSNINDKERLISIAQEIAMAKKSVDVDIQLKDRPRLAFKPSSMITPLGPQAELKKIDITCNPRIPTKVQKYHDDTDLLCAEAITSLYEHGIDETRLSRMLSTGTFGIHRKLVPTRWSITATDDIIGKKQIEEIKDAPSINTHEAYFGEYLGNYYLILMFPGLWHYELFEMYVKPGPIMEYSTDHEEYNGRKKYAEQCAGGYYTVRLAITEQLTKRKRQAGCLVLRFISDEYLMPLGVWVTREASRIALQNKPIKLSNEELMITYAKHLTQKKFGIDINPILLKRKIKAKQKRITEF